MEESGGGYAVLFERSHVRQIEGEGHRRWFSDEYFDLIVWYDSPRHGSITGFQLCYEKERGERALTWRRGQGFTHDRIDDGEKLPGPKQTPVLMPDGTFERAPLIVRLEREGSEVDRDVIRFVTQKIEEYGGAT